jgi:hypothetical protein
VAAETEPRRARPPTPPTPPPTLEALQLAELADDTMRAFLSKFHGKISWSIDMPGMLTVDDAASREEKVILEMLQGAYAERVRQAYQKAFHEQTRREQLEDEKRREDKAAESGPKLVKDMQEMIPGMMERMEDAMKGRKHVKLDDKAAADSRQTLRRLGLDYDPLDPAPTEGSGSSDNVATDPELGSGPDDAPPPSDSS